LRPDSARRNAGLFLGPVLLFAVLFAPAPDSLTPEAWRTAGVALLMAAWWITEAIPIFATALLPLALFPLLGTADIRETAAPYANPVIFLFLGGFLIAQGTQKWGLHRRLALAIVRRLGFRPARLVAGFMAATAFLSMWMSNTATAILMLPIAASVIELGGEDADAAPARNLGVCLLLGIAYSASIGGIGTLVGTPPNALMAGFFAETYGVEIGFAEWMAVGVPVVAVLLPLCWVVLTRLVFPVGAAELAGGRAALAEATGRLGRLSRGEAIVAVAFCLTATAWILRPQLERLVPGVSDAGIAIFFGVSLFVVPVDFRRGEFALDWQEASKLPWEVLLLFGGGLSLAAAISSTGLAEWIGASLGGLGTLPLPLLVGLVVLVMIFLTELTSNTASTAAFLPVLASVAVALGESPVLLAVPAVVAASCAFMLPVATPPNAIVFAGGRIRIDQMARAGLALNLLFAVCIPLILWFLLGPVLGAEPGVMPDWARPDVAP